MEKFFFLADDQIENDDSSSNSSGIGMGMGVGTAYHHLKKNGDVIKQVIFKVNFQRMLKPKYKF